MARPVPERGRRMRANSFRGRDMHEDLRGECELIGNATHDGEEFVQGRLQRKDSERPVGGRYKSTPTVRQAIDIRRAQLNIAPDEMQGPPPARDIADFRRFVDQLDNDIKQLGVDRSDLTPERKLSLEKTAIRIFDHFDSKEQRRAKLTPAEFQLKSVVDDMLVRLLAAPATAEAAVTYDLAHPLCPTSEGKPEDYMPGGSLGTKPVTGAVPMATKEVLAPASAQPPNEEEDEMS